MTIFYFSFVATKFNIMKYLPLLLCLLIGSFTYAQVGLEVNHAFGNSKVKVGGNTTKASSNATGFGLVYDLELSETLDLQPSIAFGIGEKVGGKSNNSIGIGAGLHYYFDNREKGLYAGPVLGYGYSLADVDTNVVSKGVLSSGLVLGYDISEQFTIQTGYTFSLTNPSKVDGVKASANAFGISLQYFFR